jgi:hypothetical protein
MYGLNAIFPHYATVAEAETDENGYYEVEFNIPTASPIPEPPYFAKIYGRVKDESGNPVEGADVKAIITLPYEYTRGLKYIQIYPPLPVIGGRDTTDEDGCYEIILREFPRFIPHPLDPSMSEQFFEGFNGGVNVRVIVRKEGYSQAVKTIKIGKGEEKEVNFVLRKKASIRNETPNGENQKEYGSLPSPDKKDKRRGRSYHKTGISLTDSQDLSKGYWIGADGRYHYYYDSDGDGYPEEHVTSNKDKIPEGATWVTSPWKGEGKRPKIDDDAVKGDHADPDSDGLPNYLDPSPNSPGD